MVKTSNQQKYCEENQTQRQEQILKHDIQVFLCKNKKELSKKYGTELLRNILRGNIIKGDINFLEVKASA